MGKLRKDGPLQTDTYVKVRDEIARAGGLANTTADRLMAEGYIDLDTVIAVLYSRKNRNTNAEKEK